MPYLDYISSLGFCVLRGAGDAAKTSDATRERWSRIAYQKARGERRLDVFFTQSLTELRCVFAFAFCALRTVFEHEVKRPQGHCARCTFSQHRAAFARDFHAHAS